MVLVKTADDRQPDLDALAVLLARPALDARTRRRIEQEIRAIRAGIRGERDAAYEIDFFTSDRPHWAILHDLRLDVDGLVAQIDHLLISRLLMFWVCESKHFSEGVAINEHGEWQRYWNGRAQGMASPVEQNRKHIAVLKRVFDKGLVALPRRLGVTLKPDYRSLILVSNEARVSRPRGTTKVDGIDTVIKAEQLARTIDRQIDSANALALTKVVGASDVERIARELAALHRPVHVDWSARFGLLMPSERHPPMLATMTPAQATRAASVPESRPSSARIG